MVRSRCPRGSSVPGALNKGLYFGLGEGLGQWSAQLRSLYPGAGIPLNRALTQQMLVKLPETGKQPGGEARLTALVGAQGQIVADRCAALVPGPFPAP